MSRPTTRHAVSVWHVLWLSVFAVDAAITGAGRSHQMGAVALGVLFAVLVVTEVLSTRRRSRD